MKPLTNECGMYQSAMKGILVVSFCMAIVLFHGLSGARKKPVRTRRQIFFEAIDDCHTGMPNIINNTRLINNGHIVTFDADIVVSQDYKQIQTKAIFSKCSSLKDTNCELIVSGIMGHCKLLEEKGQFYSYVFQNLQPRMKCPIKAGTYRVRNVTFDTDLALMAMAPVVGESNLQSHWKIQIIHFLPKKPQHPMMCFYVMFKIDKVKVKS